MSVFPRVPISPNDVEARVKLDGTRVQQEGQIQSNQSKTPPFRTHAQKDRRRGIIAKREKHMCLSAKPRSKANPACACVSKTPSPASRLLAFVPSVSPCFASSLLLPPLSFAGMSSRYSYSYTVRAMQVHKFAMWVVPEPNISPRYVQCLWHCQMPDAPRHVQF